jgi:hypothetical protein
MKAFTFILGLAAGYVIGTRQGREGYNRLKSRASNLWNDPRVRGKVQDAEQAVSESVPQAGDAAKHLVTAIDKKATAATPAENLPGNV